MASPRIAIAPPFRHTRLMHPGWLLAFTLALSVPAFAVEKKKPSKAGQPAADAHIKEELGVNEFTTPSIETLLAALRELHPVSYDAVARALPAQNAPDRARLALSTGAVIADGFLAVIAEKQSRIEPIGRVLLRQAKGLGVGDHVTRHTRSILEKAAGKNWEGVRSELIGTQRDVENGMLALKDEEIAHLVSLGGWWRGLEIAAGIVSEHYTAERAALLVQPSVLAYFADRVSTLNPSFKKTKLWAALDKNLREANHIAIKDDRSAPTKDEIAKLHALAKATNDALASPEE